MDNNMQLERCRIILGLSSDNTAKLQLLEVLLQKAREDIEAFCRDDFKKAVYDAEGNVVEYKDLLPKQLKGVQEDLAISRYRKRGAEGNASYQLADESVTFEDPLPPSIEKRLYPFRRIFPKFEEV